MLQHDEIFAKVSSPLNLLDSISIELTFGEFLPVTTLCVSAMENSRFKTQCHQPRGTYCGERESVCERERVCVRGLWHLMWRVRGRESERERE